MRALVCLHYQEVDADVVAYITVQVRVNLNRIDLYGCLREFFFWRGLIIKPIK